MARWRLAAAQLRTHGQPAAGGLCAAAIRGEDVRATVDEVIRRLTEIHNTTEGR